MSKGIKAEVRRLELRLNELEPGSEEYMKILELLGRLRAVEDKSRKLTAGDKLSAAVTGVAMVLPLAARRLGQIAPAYKPTLPKLWK